MAVYIFESIDLAVRGRHQLDNAIAGMGSDARRLVEDVPSAKVGLNGVRLFHQHGFDTDMMNETHHVLDADKGNERFCGRKLGHGCSLVIRQG